MVRLANSLTELLSRLSEEEQTGIRFGSASAERVSYARLVGAAARQAAALQAEPGERVLLVGHNSQAQVEALLACWWAGVVPVCLPPPARLTPGAIYRESLQSWGRITQARLGLVEAELLERCQELPLDSGWTAFPLPEAEAQAPRLARPDDLAYVQFSSGTTRDPKAVALTHGNVCHNLEALLARVLDRRAPDSCVSWLPLYHDMGLIGGLLAAMAAPGDLTLLRPYQFAARPQLWLETLSETRATISPAPNFALVQCLERVPDAVLERLDLSHLRMALLGSETIRPDTLRRFYERFRHCGLRWESLTPVYGLAEATLAVTFSPPGRGPRILELEGRELVSVGTPLSGVELKVTPEGRILTRSPSVMQGYLGEPHCGAWLETGDLGFLDDGELFLTGREKDILIVRGRNYDPAGFEEALGDVEGLDPARAAAVGVTDPSGTETILIIAERRRKESLEREPQQREAVGAVVKRTGMPVTVHLVEAGWLPRTTSGKVRRAAARERFLEEKL